MVHHVEWPPQLLCLPHIHTSSPPFTSRTHPLPSIHFAYTPPHVTTRTRPLTSETLTTPFSTARSHLKPLAHLHSPRIHTHSLLTSPHIPTSIPCTTSHTHSKPLVYLDSYGPTHVPSRTRPLASLGSRSTRHLTYGLRASPRLFVHISTSMSSSSNTRSFLNVLFQKLIYLWRLIFGIDWWGWVFEMSFLLLFSFLLATENFCWNLLLLPFRTPGNPVPRLRND